jgi:hypothetical protein
MEMTDLTQLSRDPADTTDDGGRCTADPQRLPTSPRAQGGEVGRKGSSRGCREHRETAERVAR